MTRIVDRYRWDVNVFDLLDHCWTVVQGKKSMSSFAFESMFILLLKHNSTRSFWKCINNKYFVRNSHGYIQSTNRASLVSEDCWDCNNLGKYAKTYTILTGRPSFLLKSPIVTPRSLCSYLDHQRSRYCLAPPGRHNCSSPARGGVWRGLNISGLSRNYVT